MKLHHDYIKWVRIASGFSLIELLVVVSILLTFITLAAPSFTAISQSNQLATYQSEFMAILSLARNEAVKRGIPVIVKATSPSTGKEFSGGWSLGVDSNSNGSLDNGEPTIKTHAALPSTVRFGDGTTTSIQFNSRGYLVSTAVIQLKLCQAGTNNNGYRVTLQYNGLSDVASNISCP